MIYVAKLPWKLLLEGETLEACLYQLITKDDYEYKCEQKGEGPCHPAPFAIGTDDGREPKFCFRHYFEANDGDGIGNYKIVVQ